MLSRRASDEESKQSSIHRSLAHRVVRAHREIEAIGAVGLRDVASPADDRCEQRRRRSLELITRPLLETRKLAKTHCCQVQLPSWQFDIHQWYHENKNVLFYCFTQHQNRGDFAAQKRQFSHHRMLVLADDEA